MGTYTCKYQLTEIDKVKNENFNSNDQATSRKELFQMCLDLLKKIKNMNFQDKFYQPTEDSPVSSTSSMQKDGKRTA